MDAGRWWLAAGGCLSAAASLAHLGCIVGGPAWYRFFGAGEPIARAAERGAMLPTVLTLGIAGVLAIWAAYAFAGAGVIRPLPLLRPALIAITLVYLARGAALFFPALLRRPDLSPAFLFWSSLIVLGFGAVHAIGTWQAWPQLRMRNAF